MLRERLISIITAAAGLAYILLFKINLNQSLWLKFTGLLVLAVIGTIHPTYEPFNNLLRKLGRAGQKLEGKNRPEKWQGQGQLMLCVFIHMTHSALWYFLLLPNLKNPAVSELVWVGLFLYSSGAAIYFLAWAFFYSLGEAEDDPRSKKQWVYLFFSLPYIGGIFAFALAVMIPWYLAIKVTSLVLDPLTRFGFIDEWLEDYNDQ